MTDDYKRGYFAGYAAGKRNLDLRRLSKSASKPDTHQAVEVAWYRQHGRHHDRIGHDSDGEPFVIGDTSWNVTGRPQELIEPLLPKRGADPIFCTSQEDDSHE